jgi:hypothetical protein
MFATFVGNAQVSYQEIEKKVYLLLKIANNIMFRKMNWS